MTSNSKRLLATVFTALLGLLGGLWIVSGGVPLPLSPGAPDASTGQEGPRKLGAGPNPSPACIVSDNGGAYAAAIPNGITVSPNDPIVVKLASYAGVRSWSLTVFGLDELSAAPVLSYSVGPPGSYSFTFPNAAGRAVLLQSVVNGGVDINGAKRSSYSTTIGLFSLTASGQRVLATGETFETCPAGWICDWNNQLRATGTGTYGGLYTTAVGSLSLTTTLTFYQATFDTTFSTAKNTATSSNGVKVLAAGPVLVTASASFNTGASSTSLFWSIFKNGTALPGIYGIDNTYGSSAYSSTSTQVIDTAAVNDVYTLWATAANNTISATYVATLTVTGLGTLQGVAGPAGPPGPPSVIGGGSCGAPVSGAITLPLSTGCIAVDLTSVDATVNVGSITPYDGLAYQFDLQAGTKSILFSGGTFVTVANGSTTPLSTMSVEGGGQSVVIKYNAANAWWTTP